MSKQSEAKLKAATIQQSGTEIQVNRIKEEHNAREVMGDVAALATSMKKQGQLTNIVVRYDADDENKPFAIVDGHRRVAAAKSLGWKTIRADIADYANSYSRDVASFAYNMARESLTTFEVARELYHLKSTYGLSGEQIQKRIPELFAGARCPYTRQHINRMCTGYEKAGPELRKLWAQKSVNNDMPLGSGPGSGRETILGIAALSKAEQVVAIGELTRSKRGDGTGGKEGKNKPPRKATEKMLRAAMAEASKFNSSEAKAIVSALGFALGESRKVIIGNAVIYDADKKPDKAPETEKKTKKAPAKKAKKAKKAKTKKRAKKAAPYRVVRKKR